MTDTDKKEMKTVKIISFAGDEGSWREWSKKVLAFAEVKGWKLAVTDENNAKCTENMRKEALNFLMMSLTGKAFAFIENSKSAQTTWEELCEEHEPSEESDLFEIEKQFSDCKFASPEKIPPYGLNAWKR